MFSKPPPKVPYFGHWADESGHAEYAKHALNVLIDALSRCRDEDMRTADVFASVDYLEKGATRNAPFANFRKALDIKDPVERVNKVHSALVAIRSALGG